MFSVPLDMMTDFAMIRSKAGYSMNSERAESRYESCTGSGRQVNGEDRFLSPPGHRLRILEHAIRGSKMA